VVWSLRITISTLVSVTEKDNQDTGDLPNLVSVDRQGSNGSIPKDLW